MYHCCASALRKIDAIQRRFLDALDCSERDELLVFNLAPLSTRRDIAMLGVIHRALLGEGPDQFRKFFRYAIPQSRRHTRSAGTRHESQIDETNIHHDFMRASAFGLQRIYNHLPAFIVEQGTVKLFQNEAHSLVKSLCEKGVPDWERMYCPRTLSLESILENYSYHKLLSRERKRVRSGF